MIKDEGIVLRNVIPFLSLVLIAGIGEYLVLSSVSVVEGVVPSGTESLRVSGCL